MSETRTALKIPFKLSDVLKGRAYKNQAVVRRIREAIASRTLTRVFESDMGFKGKGSAIEEVQPGRGVLKDFFILEGSNFDEWFDDATRSKEFTESTSSGKLGSDKFQPLSLSVLIDKTPEEIEKYEKLQVDYQTKILEKLKPKPKK